MSKLFIMTMEGLHKEFVKENQLAYNIHGKMLSVQLQRIGLLGILAENHDKLKHGPIGKILVG